MAAGDGPFGCLDVQATQPLFGELIGTSHQAVHKMQAKGVVPKSGTLRQWLLIYCENLRETAGGRSGEHQGRMAEAKIAQALADAEWKRVQIFERTGAIAAEQQPLMEQWADAVRMSVMSAGAKILEQAGEAGHELDPDAVLSPLRAALQAAARYPASLSPDDVEGGHPVGATGADVDSDVGGDVPPAA